MGSRKPVGWVRTFKEAEAAQRLEDQKAVAQGRQDAKALSIASVLPEWVDAPIDFSKVKIPPEYPKRRGRRKIHI